MEGQERMWTLDDLHLLSSDLTSLSITVQMCGVYCIYSIHLQQG